MLKIGNATVDINNAGYITIRTTNGYHLLSINPDRNEVYFLPGKTRYSTDQILEKVAGMEFTYKVVENPDKRLTLHDTIVSSERLKKVERKLEELKDEINCIRNND